MIGIVIGGSSCAKVVWPDGCHIDTHAAVAGGYAHVCDCTHGGGVVFAYTAIKDIQGNVIAWRTTETCDGQPIPRVMISTEFPAWLGATLGDPYATDEPVKATDESAGGE